MQRPFLTPLVEKVIGCAITVHRALGPGLLESAYQRCLACELRFTNLPFLQQLRVPITYRDEELDCGYRVDFLINGQLLVEIKAIDLVLPVHRAQVLTYLRLLRLRQGLLMNFNVPRLVDGLSSVLCPEVHNVKQ